MCEFFSCVVTRKGDLFFCEDNSHEEIIDRAKLRDSDAHVRHWVRVEVTPQGDGWGPVRVDETTVPAWWHEDAPAWEGKVLDLAGRVRPAWEAYKAVERPAWEAYEAVRRPALEAYKAVERPALEAYEAVRRPALEAYEAVERPALEAYEAVERPAWEAYEAVERPAREAYEAVRRPAVEAYEAVERPAWEAYKAVRRPAWEAYVQALSTVTGYVAAGE